VQSRLQGVLVGGPSSWRAGHVHGRLVMLGWLAGGGRSGRGSAIGRCRTLAVNKNHQRSNRHGGFGVDATGRRRFCDCKGRQQLSLSGV